jgi:acetolactate synthase-1/2/3 large subunit
MSEVVKYSDYFMDVLLDLGYTHCFFVPGGNMMHLLESARTRFKCISSVHEVATVIGAEYFNETSKNQSKAFALVTAGPGITNCVTGIASSWLESRSVLIVGGQAKSTDLSEGTVRQIGHQEIDGISLVAPITKVSEQIRFPIGKPQITSLIQRGQAGRPGPVFIEICLDATSSFFPRIHDSNSPDQTEKRVKPFSGIEEIESYLSLSERPLFLIGGGVSRDKMNNLFSKILEKKIPIATTLNGADRIPYDYEFYCGRPNWYGMRWANLLIQQCDLLITFGTRLGIQQTGFNWEEFAPLAKVVQVDIDKNELNKGKPKIDLAIHDDADEVLEQIIDLYSKEPTDWLEFIRNIRIDLDNPEIHNNISDDRFIELQSFLYDLGNFTSCDDVIIPCSSGGSFTGMMQMFRNKRGQKIVTDSNLASMGYGLAGAIGASLANPSGRTLLVEGDGGFAQNMQEMGTVIKHNLRIKIFLMDNGGYATIKNSQRASFQGNFIGCDYGSGLMLPDWEKFFSSYGLNAMVLTPHNKFSEEFDSRMESDRPEIFIVKLDPEQEYFPKITSRRNEEDKIISNPLHIMNPPLSAAYVKRYMPWLH